MDKVQLITANDELAIKLQRHFGGQLIHTDSVDHAVLNVSGGAIGTTIIHGFDKLTVLLRIVTFLRDACPSMAITCLVDPDNVTRVMNSELKPYIYRVLPNNTSTGQIVLAANSSQQEHQALQEREALGENLTVQLDGSQFMQRPPDRSSGWMRMLSLLLIGGTGLLGWYFYHQQAEIKDLLSSGPTQPVVVPESVSDNTATLPIVDFAVAEMQTAAIGPTEDPMARATIPVTSLLSKATDAVLDNRLIEPFGNNAVAYYQQTLSLEPENQEAIDGLSQVETIVLERVNIALTEADYEQAGANFLALSSISPEHPELSNIKKRLVQGLTPKPKPQSTNTVAAPRSVAREKTQQNQRRQIQTDNNASNLLGRIDNALNTGAFPAAINLLNQPRSDLRNYEYEFQSRTANLRERLIASINDGISRGDTLLINNGIEQLADLGFGADAQNLKTQYQNESQYQNQLSTTIPLSPMTQTSQTTPTRSAPVDVIEQYTKATAIEVVPPVYPRSAERRGADGYVVLSYAILTDGSVGEITVTDSQPAKLFDQAAITSIQASRFSPASRNGIPEIQVVTQKLTFKF